MKKKFSECSKDEKISRLEECGLYIENPDSWTDENCERFKAENPGYEVDFDVKETVEIVRTNVIGTQERRRLLVVEADKYGKDFNFGGFDSGEGYSYLTLKPDIGDELTLEMPFNINDLFRTFSKSNARKLTLTNWDLSDLTSIVNPFEGNSLVEEINMSGWNYPKPMPGDHNYYMAYNKMFCGCNNLKSLRFTSPYLSPKLGQNREYRILNKELENCFEGCKNLEYVFFERGSDDANLYVQKIAEASEKEVTIDGEFDFLTWVAIRGGLMLRGETFLNGHLIGLYVNEEPGIGGIRFVGKLNEGAIDCEDRKAEKFYKNKYITEEDYRRYKEYLDSLR